MILFAFVVSGWVSGSVGWTIPRPRSYRVRGRTSLEESPLRAAGSSDDQLRDATMCTALCVVPPDDAWDQIQRVRHLARDRSYHKWPPAIRLFHPFTRDISSAALEIARLVQKYDIEPFEVVLNQWMVIPNQEALEAEMDALKVLPEQAPGEQYGYQETEVDRLIAREERIGKRKKKRRMERKRQRAEKGHTTLEGQRKTRSGPGRRRRNDGSEVHAEYKESPRELLEKQKQMYEEFNGPCIVCLEPDEESSQHLSRLREILRKELFSAYDGYSPSSSISNCESLPRSVLDTNESSFRPLVPIGGFPTVSSAIEMARKLRKLWDPLVFNVTDLHLISTAKENTKPSIDEEEFAGNREYQLHKTSGINNYLQSEEWDLSSEGQFGCDAMVMLVGEEVKMDQQLNEEIANYVMNQGEPGGYEQNQKVAKSGSDLEENEAGRLEQWLDEDDDWDEGAVMVIGRTHYFTGEMRIYVGMPASSMTDGKYRVLGEAVSGAARRRGTVHRSGALWGEGEFGRRESDYLPWSKNEKSGKPIYRK